jgi:protocatechuate 3,4-dioxygenase beta subunit
MDFAAWAGRMVQQFGETVREFLSEVWQAVSGGQYLPQARERGSVNISPGTGPKPRKFGQSLQAAPGVAF